MPDTVKKKSVMRGGPYSPYYLWIGGILFAVAFTVLIWYLSPLLKHFIDTLLPDQGSSWYYWKLPARDSLTMFIAWSLYATQQIATWAVIYWAQCNLARKGIISANGLTKYNLMIVAITLPFIFAHLIETQLWFDGLAQDVPILTSQGSVIIMLAIVLIMENQRRGLFMGRKAGKPYTAIVMEFFRHSHMYIISWALIYTFWFHPMAGDPQLTSGFFYMFLLFTQMWLAYTKLHLDKRWIITLESWVAIHAVIVAIFNTTFFDSAVIWPMFFLGFAFMFVFTYSYALNLKKWVHYIIIALYAALMIWIYLPSPIGFGRSLANLFRLEFIWIPAVLFGLSAGFAGLAYIAFRGRETKKA